MKLASLLPVFLLLTAVNSCKDHGHSVDTFLGSGPSPIVKYFGNNSQVLSPYAVDPVATIEQRLASVYDQMVVACCKNSKQCSNQYCNRKCPDGQCHITGWKGGPTTSISSFQINGDNPASYTPTLIVPQNYTNYNLNTSTTATFAYTQSFTDTITVTNSQTLTVSMSITESVKIEILSVSMTEGFSFSTTETESKTTSTAKTWSITYGPVEVPPCSGLNMECYILTANFNPTFTAVYKVDGTATDECDGNWYWDSEPLSSFSGYDMCIACNPELCPSPAIVMDNSITITGQWNGIFGAEVQCTSKPYPLPRNQCSV